MRRRIMLHCSAPIDEYEGHKGELVQKADLSKVSTSTIQVGIPKDWKYYINATYDGTSCLILSDHPIFCIGSGNYKQLVFKENAYVWMGWKCWSCPKPENVSGVIVKKDGDQYKGIQDYNDLGYKVTEQNFKQIVFSNTDVFSYA